VTVRFRRALHGSVHHLATFVHVGKHCGCQEDRFVVTTCLLHGTHPACARIIGERACARKRALPACTANLFVQRKGSSFPVRCWRDVQEQACCCVVAGR
jgi:hypothetical protein